MALRAHGSGPAILTWGWTQLVQQGFQAAWFPSTLLTRMLESAETDEMVFTPEVAAGSALCGNPAASPAGD